MKAVALHRFGGPEVLALENLPEPVLGPDCVLIAAHAAGVNPADWKIREGYLTGRFPHHFPLIPGWDVAGVVTAVGPAAARVRGRRRGDGIRAQGHHRARYLRRAGHRG